MKKTTILLLLSMLLMGTFFTSCTEEPTPLVTVECTNADVYYLDTKIPAKGITVPRGTELEIFPFNYHLPCSVKIFINGKLEAEYDNEYFSPNGYSYTL